MDKWALKRRLKRDAGAPSSEAFEIVWEDLVDEQRVTEAIEDGERGYADLLDEAKRLVNLQRRTLEKAGSYSGSRPGRVSAGEVSEENVTIDLSDYELLCTRTYSQYLSIWAAKRSDVLQFRAHTLGRAWPTGWETDEDLENLATTALLPEDDALALVRSPEHRALGGPWLSYAESDQAEVFHVEVRPGSVLDRLRKRSEELAKSLPWHVADAARWLLTGAPVGVSPIRGRINKNDATITVTTRPFVDARTATVLYRRAQRQLRDGDNRPVSERACAVLLFVSERTSQQGERPGWGRLIKEWNSSYPPSWTFRDDRAGFMRAYRRAHRALLGKNPPAAWR